MLMVTTTVGVVNWVHSNTTSTGPADWSLSSGNIPLIHRFKKKKKKDVLVTLSLEFVVSSAGLEQGLINPSTTSDDTDGGTGATRNGLFGTGWEADTSLVIFGRVPNDSGIASGCSGERTTVTNLLLDAADDRSFGELAHRKNIPNVKSSLPAAVDEGASVKALGGNEGFLAELVAVWITEDDTSKRSTTAG